MPDREKVIKGLEVCQAADLSEDGNPCKPCPYYFDGMCQNTMRKDALALLKEQDVLPGTWLLDRPGHYKCSVCGAQWGQAALMMRHCPECGRKMEI